LYHTELSPVFIRIQEAGRKAGRPLAFSVIAEMIEADPVCSAKFRRINEELEVLGDRSLDAELIGHRVGFPTNFVISLLWAAKMAILEIPILIDMNGAASRNGASLQ
jgi:hypothetical protein